MLPKAHLTSHSRMSGSRWVIRPSWLSVSWRSFFVWFFCVFLPPLLNIFCFCYVHTISVLYRAHLCMKCSLVSLIFLKRSLVFPILLFSSISLHWSMRKAFLSLLAIFGTLHSDAHIPRSRSGGVVVRRYPLSKVRNSGCTLWWTGRPGVLQLMGSKRVGHDWVTNTFTLTSNE